MDPPDSVNGKGNERRPDGTLLPGARIAVGRSQPGLKALTKRFLREYLTEKLGSEILDAQSVKALDGDTAAAKFVYDYCGRRPVEEHADVSAFDLLMEKLQIEVQGRDAPGLR